MRHPYLRFALIVVAGGLVYWLATRPTAPLVGWRTNFDAALSDARAQGRPLVADFWASWCGPCLAMDDEVFSTDDVTNELQSFVAVRVDLSDASLDAPGAAIARRYGVDSMPTLLIIQPSDGREIARLTGLTEAANVAAFLRQHTATSR